MYFFLTNLRQGDITNIKADAIVHASNRTLSDKSFITRKLYEKAGVELWQEVQKIKSKENHKL